METEKPTIPQSVIDAMDTLLETSKSHPGSHPYLGLYAVMGEHDATVSLGMGGSDDAIASHLALVALQNPRLRTILRMAVSLIDNPAILEICLKQVRLEASGKRGGAGEDGIPADILAHILSN